MHKNIQLQNISEYIEANDFEGACKLIDKDSVQYFLKEQDFGQLLDFLEVIYPQIDVDKVNNHIQLLIDNINVHELSIEFTQRIDDILKLCHEIGKLKGDDYQCIEILSHRIIFNRQVKQYEPMIAALWLIENHYSELNTIKTLLEIFEDWFNNLLEYPEVIQLQLWFFKGSLYFESMQYSEAIMCYQKADECAISSGKYEAHSNCNERMGVTYGVIGNYSMQLHHHLIAKEIREAHELFDRMGNSYVNLGLCYMNLGDKKNAITYYREGIKWQLQYDRIYDVHVGKLLLAFVLDHGEEKINLLNETIEYYKSIKDEYRLAEAYNVMFESYAKANIHDEAITIYHKILDILKHKNMDLNLAMAYKTMGEILLKDDIEIRDAKQSEIVLKKSIEIFRTLGVKDSLYQSLEIYSRILEEQERWEEFSKAFKEYHSIKQEVLNTEVQMKLHALEDQRQRDLEEHERKIQKIKIEEQEKLLHNVLPAEIAIKIMAGEHNIADYVESVSVFFFDIVGFTEISRTMSPGELLEGLNHIFTQIDSLAIDHSIEKIKTIGDAYMAVSGISNPIQNHAEHIANFALAILDNSKDWMFGGKRIAFRMGIHCGPVISGIIGSQRFAFDIWGDTVNIASRMESSGHPGKIHVTEEFAQLLQQSRNHVCIQRGLIDIKGRGFVNTYWLE